MMKLLPTGRSHIALWASGLFGGETVGYNNWLQRSTLLSLSPPSVAL